MALLKPLVPDLQTQQPEMTQLLPLRNLVPMPLSSSAARGKSSASLSPVAPGSNSFSLDPINPTLTSLIPNQQDTPAAQPTAPAFPQLAAAPMPTLPAAGLRPLVTSPQQQQMQRQMDEYSKMANVHQGLTHSGAPAHGFWQHLAKIAEGAGNVAGDVFAPGVEANIPGSQLYRAREASAGAQGLAGLENQQTSQQEAASQEGLEGAQAGEARAREQAIENPPQTPDKYTFQQTDHGLMRIDNQTGAAAPVTFNGQPLNPAVKPESLHDPFHEWLADPQNYDKFQRAMAAAKASAPAKNGSFMSMFAAYKLLNEAYNKNPAILPVVGPMIAHLLEGQGNNLPPDAAAILSNVPLDQPLSPVTGQPIGTSMSGAPTASTRAQAQTAQRVLTEMPSVRKTVIDAANDLGPTKGRILMGFLLGDVGSTGDPKLDRQLSALRTNLTFASSASARFHLNSVRAMEQFDKLVSAGKSSEPAIEGFLDAVQSWAQTAAKQEAGYGEGAPSSSKLPPQSVVDSMKDGQYVHGPGGTYQKKNGKLIAVGAE